jgi:predicted enzyme related to lactoylglutathione lyase
MMNTPKLAIIELRVRDWPKAVAWFRNHFHLSLKMEQASEEYALLETGSVQLAIKGDPQAVVGNQVMLQWEVADVAECLTTLVAAGVNIIKPMKTSDEGYRRIVVEGPGGMPLLLFDFVAREMNNLTVK